MWATTIHFAHYAEIFSLGQESSIFSISFLAEEDWSKLTRHNHNRLSHIPLFAVFGLMKTIAATLKSVCC